VKFVVGIYGLQLEMANSVFNRSSTGMVRAQVSFAASAEYTGDPGQV
jgi:hypothetical protein